MRSSDRPVRRKIPGTAPKRSNKFLAVVVVLVGFLYFADNKIAYNEDGYAMLITDSRGQHVATEPGFYWLEWGARTDRYKKELTYEFKRDEKPLSEYKYE